MQPPATMTARRARDAEGLAALGPVAAEAAAHGGHAPAAPRRQLQALDARVGDDVRAVGDRARQGRHRRRLLGFVRAAVQAAPRAAAAALVAADEAALRCRRFAPRRASSKSERLAVSPSTTGCTDSSSSMRAAAASSAAAGSPSARPNSSCQRASTFSRQAPDDRRVHEGGAADAAPLQDRRGRAAERRLLALVAEEAVARLRLGHAELGGRAAAAPPRAPPRCAPDAASTRAAAPPPAPEPTMTKSDLVDGHAARARRRRSRPALTGAACLSL